MREPPLQPGEQGVRLRTTAGEDDVTAGRVSYDVIDTPEPQAQAPEAAKTTDEPVEAQQ